MEIKQKQLPLPSWIFNDKFTSKECSYFLLSISPSGTVSVDGCHQCPRDVVKAKKLIESLNCIPKEDGTRYKMIKIEDVPELNVSVNKGAVDTLNEAFDSINEKNKR